MGISSALGSSALLPAGLGFRNKIINGAMTIAQRGASAVNNSASNNTYGGPDRWHIYGNNGSTMSIAQSTTVPTGQGFVNSVLVTSLAATSVTTGYYGVRQYIEGNNTADLAWGTTGAKPITITFWVRSSITGTYSLALHNSANTRAYPATYTVDSANTWEKKTLYIQGETSGTWVTDNGIGLAVWFDLGSHSGTTSGTANSWNTALYTRTSGTVNWVGTNGATFYLTGVQFEQNTQPTPFEQRPFGVELTLCKRYYEKSFDYDVTPADGVYSGAYISNVPYTDYWVLAIQWIPFSVEKRKVPDMAWYGSSGKWQANNSDNSWTTFAQSPTSAVQGVVGVKKNGFSLGIHNNGANGYNGVAYSRMVRGDWVASAEL